MSARTVAVGPYPLRLPDFWEDISLRDKPPLHASNSLVGPGVSFDFAVILGIGDDEEERARIEQAMLGARPAARVTRLEESYHGLELRGFRLEDMEQFGEGSIHESYSVRAYDDLVLFAYSLTDGHASSEDSLRLLFFTMVEGAIVERGYARR